MSWSWKRKQEVAEISRREKKKNRDSSLISPSFGEKGKNKVTMEGFKNRHTSASFTVQQLQTKMFFYNLFTRDIPTENGQRDRSADSHE